MKINRDELLAAGGSMLISPGEMVRTLRNLKSWSQLDVS